jgi:hypothetical protein
MCPHFKESFTLAIFSMKMLATRMPSGMLEQHSNMKILLISNLNYKVLLNRIPLYALMCPHFKDSFPLVIFVMKLFATMSGFLGQYDNMKILLIFSLNYKVLPNKIPIYALMCLHFKDSFPLEIFAMKMLAIMHCIT